MRPFFGNVSTAETIPLKIQLRRAERRRKLKAAGLVAPLFLFLLITFIVPIILLLYRAIQNPEIVEVLPRTFGMSAAERQLSCASVSFDGLLGEILMLWGAGGTLHLPPPRFLAAGDGLVELLRRAAITTVVLPPSALASLPSAAELPALERIVCVGEVLTPALAARWSRGREIWNGYGQYVAELYKNMKGEKLFM